MAMRESCLVELSSCRVVELSSSRVVELSSSRVVELSSCRVTSASLPSTTRQLDNLTTRQLLLEPLMNPHDRRRPPGDLIHLDHRPRQADVALGHFQLARGVHQEAMQRFVGTEAD